MVAGGRECDGVLFLLELVLVVVVFFVGNNAWVL